MHDHEVALAPPITENLSIPSSPALVEALDAYAARGAVTRAEAAREILCRVLGIEYLDAAARNTLRVRLDGSPRRSGPKPLPEVRR